MSRKRYISTTISIDKRIARLSDSAALLWTWMIPHAEEDATITGDIEELRWTVVPSRPQMDVEACLCELEGQRLIARHGAIIYFDSTAFYRYQSNIHQDKRADHSARFTKDERRTAENSGEQRESAENSGEQRESAENSASFSLSFSPSLSEPLSNSDESDGFDEFWSAYPRRENKKKSVSAWKRLSERERQLAVSVAQRMSELFAAGVKEKKYIPLPSTYLNQKRWEDWAEATPADWCQGEQRPYDTMSSPPTEPAPGTHWERRYDIMIQGPDKYVWKQIDD